MSIHAGQILHVGANNIIDRIQSAGLGDVRIPQNVIREVGNPQIVDKVAGDPDFTFTVETWDVSTDIEAWLTGKLGAIVGGDAYNRDAPALTDAAGTPYLFADQRYVHVASPWKDPLASAGGAVIAGHIVPNYFPTRIRYRAGIGDQFATEVELGGGSFYYAGYPPVEQVETGNGVLVAFATSNPAIPHRVGGAAGTTFRSVLGVSVNGVPSIEGADFTQAPSNSAAPAVATVTFTTPPPVGADIRMVYFTNAVRTYPQSDHPAVTVKPGQVRPRNICVYMGAVGGPFGGRVKIGGVQSFELEASVDSDITREFCNEQPVGRTVNGRDVNGDVTVQSKDAVAFFALLEKVTGVARTEVFGFLNENAIPLEIVVMDPRDPAVALKTLYVDDAKVQVPGTPARVNAATNFTFRYESRSGVYTAYKGAKP